MLKHCRPVSITDHILKIIVPERLFLVKRCGTNGCCFNYLSLTSFRYYRIVFDKKGKQFVCAWFLLGELGQFNVGKPSSEVVGGNNFINLIAQIFSSDKTVFVLGCFARDHEL